LLYIGSLRPHRQVSSSSIDTEHAGGGHGTYGFSAEQEPLRTVNSLKIWNCVMTSR